MQTDGEYPVLPVATDGKGSKSHLLWAQGNCQTPSWHSVSENRYKAGDFNEGET